jgi:NADP-reducing hydrogenase subunit HndB
MAKMTLKELQALRDQKRKEMDARSPEGKDVQIVIGMGTCGIAAGAKATLDAFVAELAVQNIGGAMVRQTGCMGLCHSEPTVEVVVPGMPTIIYGNVSADVARRIVQEHIVNRRLVSDHVFDKPAPDIMK